MWSFKLLWIMLASLAEFKPQYKHTHLLNSTDDQCNATLQHMLLLNLAFVWTACRRSNQKQNLGRAN